MRNAGTALAATFEGREKELSAAFRALTKHEVRQRVLTEGVRIGAAEVSTLHANFIVNGGGASAADVRALAELVRETVRRERGLELAYEVEFVGDWGT